MIINWKYEFITFIGIVVIGLPLGYLLLRLRQLRYKKRKVSSQRAAFSTEMRHRFQKDGPRTFFWMTYATLFMGVSIGMDIINIGLRRCELPITMKYIFPLAIAFLHFLEFRKNAHEKHCNKTN